MKSGMTGYYPVVWTNVKYRMIYFNMGHNDIDFASKPGKQLSSTFASDAQNKLILNAVMWLGKGAAGVPRPPPASGKPTALSVLNYLRQISGRQTSQASTIGSQTAGRRCRPTASCD